ncbi:MAG: polyprenyl synthetase family protein [Chloroflexota bacterium]
MLTEQINKGMELVEDRLVSVVKTDVQTLSEASAHIISSGGKRVRPKLLMLVYLACGGRNVEEVIDLAASIEMVHTATLVHDDINDHSDFRRGKVAVHKRWGRTFALLTGDYLFTKVYELMAPYGNPFNVMMSDACVKLVEGETLQAHAAKTGEIDREIYKKIIARKTASLFEAAASMGSAYAGAPQETIDALTSYGYNLGMSFQLVDDILDVIGDAEEMGKPVGLDVAQARGVVVAENGANGSAYSNGNGNGNGNGVAIAERPVLAEDDPVKRMMERMRSSGALEIARLQAEEMSQRARKNLQVLPESEAKAELDNLIDLVLNRTN